MENKQQLSIASPDGALSFLFGIFGLLLWYLPTHPRSLALLLSVGMIWIVLSFGAMAAALLNVIRGKPKGNINIMATLLLGFFPGINTLISFGALLLKVHYQPRIFGIIYIIGAIFCFGVMMKRMDKPLYRFISTFLVGMGLLLLGMGDLLRNMMCTSIGGWCMFGYAVLSFYYGLSVMYQHYDANLPQGITLAELVKRS